MHQVNHELRSAALAVVVNDPGRLDPAASAPATRVPAYPASRLAGSDRQEANPAQRRPASPPGSQRQDPRAQGLARSGHDRQAGFDLALAPDVGRAEMGLQQTEGKETRSAARVRRSYPVVLRIAQENPSWGSDRNPSSGRKLLDEVENYSANKPLTYC